MIKMKFSFLFLAYSFFLVCESSPQAKPPVAPPGAPPAAPPKVPPAARPGVPPAAPPGVPPAAPPGVPPKPADGPVMDIMSEVSDSLISIAKMINQLSGNPKAVKLPVPSIAQLNELADNIGKSMSSLSSKLPPPKPPVAPIQNVPK